MKSIFKVLSVVAVVLLVLGVGGVVLANNATQVDVKISYPCFQWQNPCDTSEAVSDVIEGDIVNIYITLLDVYGDPATAGPAGEFLSAITGTVSSNLGSSGSITENQFLSDSTIVNFAFPGGTGPAARAHVDYSNASIGTDVITVVVDASPDPLVGSVNVNVVASSSVVVDEPTTEATAILVFQEGPQDHNGNQINPTAGGEAIIRISANGTGTVNGVAQISFGPGSVPGAELRTLNGVPSPAPFLVVLPFLPSPLVDQRLLVSAPEAGDVIINVQDQSSTPLDSGGLTLTFGVPPIDFCKGLADYDQDVDANDVTVFLNHFGRSIFNNPCPPDGPAPCAKTGQRISYATGDDGGLERGVDAMPRFKDNLDGTISDNLTGLIWLKEANCFGTRTWDNALTDCNGLADGQCGLTDGSTAGDWRLPNSFELESLRDIEYYGPVLSNTAGTGQWSEGDPFNNVHHYVYWSSTTYAFSSSYAWCVDMIFGGVGTCNKEDINYYVWPVRGGH